MDEKDQGQGQTAGEELEEEVLHQWETCTPASSAGPEVIRMAVPGGYIYRVESQSFHVRFEEFQSLMGGLLQSLPEMMGMEMPAGEVREFTVVTDEEDELPEA